MFFKLLVQRKAEVLFLIFCTLICISAQSFRMYSLDNKGFFFLNWNLFLAIIPYGLTTLAISSESIKNSKIKVGFILMIWILFFPNAPYILTDLYHLKQHLTMPLWYDILLILSYAWTGLLFGLLSLRDLDSILEKWISKRNRILLIVGLLFLSAFGIYLGRFLRWNSWDLINNPQTLMRDIAHRFIYPIQHPRTWGLTIFMGAFLNMMYWSFSFLKKSNTYE